MKLDLHVHSRYSVKDCSLSLRDLVRFAMARGLSGFALTDHNTVRGHAEARRFSRQGFIIIPGIEISTTKGHVLGLGVSEEIPSNLHPAEAVEKVHEQGGIAVAAHPFSIGRSPSMVYMARFDALEVLNARAGWFSNMLAKGFAERNGIPGVGGSDAHVLEDVGEAYTVLNCEPKIEGIIEEIRRGETSAGGRSLPLPLTLWRIIQRVLHKG
jgi:predicted metal-dependent phosphoesterase TrpH